MGKILPIVNTKDKGKSKGIIFIKKFQENKINVIYERE